MKLWTVQPLEVWEALSRGEPYHCDFKRSSFADLPEFESAYRWLAQIMRERVGEAPHGVAFPAWAWARYAGKEKKPDLRVLNYVFEDEVLLTLDVADERVLLTCHEEWHCVLSNFPSRSPEEWEEEFDKDFTQEEIEATWHRHVFSIEEKKYVQATLWEIRPEDVVAAQRVTRKRRPPKSHLTM